MLRLRYKDTFLAFRGLFKLLPLFVIGRERERLRLELGRLAGKLILDLNQRGKCVFARKVIDVREPIDDFPDGKQLKDLFVLS